VRPTFSQRFRSLFEAGNRRMDFRHAGVRALLVLLGLAVIAMLGAAAWPIVMELRSEYADAADPRPAYVNRVREQIQKVTETAFARLPKPAGTGSLLLRIELGPDGALLSAAVAESSRLPALDELALRIVRESAPFEPFPEVVRKTTRVMEITSAFHFQYSDEVTKFQRFP
jgi:TonB family protein